ncbi:MAG: DUF5752 family protein [Scytonema sp. PMC 1069.18]|nr:DUF5752 family protein [Scytonema sp. PMC 1069.18]MEC4882631.1 DUF5752 family protein [Scytonema sp. PMC 1070.18]
MPDERITTEFSGSEYAFALKDCALIAIATGKRALTLKELRDNLLTIGLDSIYFHFWGSLLEPRFEEREYNNNFASWARHGLHDDILAERLAMNDPTAYPNLEDLRQDLIDVVEQRLDESEHLYWFPATEPFEFIRSQIVVFDTYKRVERPEQLAELMPSLSTSSIFYHFIDARRRLTDSQDDFRFWLSSFNGLYNNLCDRLANIDPYFSSLSELRKQLTVAFSLCCGETN